MSRVRFDVLVAVTVKNIVLWGLTPCNVSCHVSEEKSTLLSTCLAYCLTLKVDVVVVCCSETSVNFCPAYVRCKVPTLLTMKCSIFWCMMLYNPLEIHGHFRRM